MASFVDQDTEGKVEGALTQGLRLLSQQAELSPTTFSPPESPTLFTQPPPESPIFSTQPDDNKGSFLFQTANDESGPIPASPSSPSWTPFTPYAQLSKVRAF